jgi:hypothetical protein
MKRFAILATGAALLLVSAGAPAQPPGAVPRPGDEYEITLAYESSSNTSEGSSSSTRGRSVFLERLVAVRSDGLELEYDLPKGTSQEDRDREWMFPARVLRRSTGEMVLLNQAELELRLGRLLNAAKWSRDVCGRWMFTWNAFRIECDPAAVLETVGALDLRSTDLREGAAYRDPNGRSPGTLARLADGPGGARFATSLEIDPAATIRARAEADVAVGEIMRKPVTLEEAMRKRAGEQVSGTIAVTFDARPGDGAWRQIKVTRLTIQAAGKEESQTRTETLERRLISGGQRHE